MANPLLHFSFLLLVVALEFNGSQGFSPIMTERFKVERTSPSSFTTRISKSANVISERRQLSAFVSSQEGLKENDKIECLPGQPDGLDFNQYSGYVTIDQKKGRSLFYYFVDSPTNSYSKPLVLSLNGGSICSSVGMGAFMELGPFKVNKDSKTLSKNEYGWNSEANIIFLDSPLGAGFSYSNSNADYKDFGDKRVTQDLYTFLVHWLRRFPEYKTSDVFVAGQGYASHVVLQLANLILLKNKSPNQQIIVNLKGILDLLGNPYLDWESSNSGSLDYDWSHALISDEIYFGVKSNSDFSKSGDWPANCIKYINRWSNATSNINSNDIYASLCNSTSSFYPISHFDPCSASYVGNYFNDFQVQIALHANIATVPYRWETCNYKLYAKWKDSPPTVLPIISELMKSSIQVWIYSGDTTDFNPITSTKYSINKLGLSVKSSWYPWYIQNEVGGYVVEYDNLTFVTVRGAGFFVPSYQPARALALSSSFIEGKLPPSS